jgi:hypothetical protein
MSTASKNNLAHEGKMHEILAHLTKTPFDVNKRNEVSCSFLSMQTLASFLNDLSS